MAGGRRGRGPLPAVVAVCLGLVLGPVSLLAGTTGKLAGTVLDENGKPVVAATVVVSGLNMGAYSDTLGNYAILNIPSGTYAIGVSRLGYVKTTVNNVVISADRTTPLNIRMAEAAVAMEEVVVTAERPPVDLNKTSSEVTITSEEIEALPVQNLSELVELQAGVVDGHFRGGRKNEVQYQVDGVTVNNAFDNQSSLTVDRSLLEEVQIINGTFDAEYGQAMSGVVNAVLKQGSSDFRWGGELYLGNFLYSSNETSRFTNPQVDPMDFQSYQASISGPVTSNTTFLLSGRRYVFDDYVQAERRFVPTDSSDFENAIFRPGGDGEEVPLAYSREWSGAAKITDTSIPGTKLSYQAIFNHTKGRRANWAYRFNPDGLSRQKTFSIAHGLDWTQTLNAETYFEINLRQNYFKYTDYRYEDVQDSRYDDAGQPQGSDSYENGAIIQGVDLTRFLQKTDSYLIKASVVSQVNASHQVKAGGEFQLPKVTFGTPGYITFNTGGGENLVRHVDEPPDYPDPRTYHPVIGAVYAQDQADWKDLKLRAGLRLEYFDARSTLPSDLANPANAIQGAPESVPVSTTAKAVLAPRLGVAYPIEDRAAIHFAYGHFYQYPAIGEIFNNADYRVLTNIQAGEARYGVLGNPDVKPEKTVQYEFGYKHNVTQDLGVEVTAFYKDIRDLLGVEFIDTYNGAQYARLSNADFGNIVGFTVSLDHRRFGPAQVSLDYTWQRAQGNSSDPRETATRASAGEDPRPRLIPFGWDLRNSLRLTVAFSRPGNYAASAILKAGSGQPYTPEIGSGGFGAGLNTNSGRKPGGLVIDLRADKEITGFGQDIRVFTRVFNLFDTSFFNGPVYPSTGSPYYSRFPEADRVALTDPTRFYPPRRVEFGLSFGSF